MGTSSPPRPEAADSLGRAERCLMRAAADIELARENLKEARMFVALRGDGPLYAVLDKLGTLRRALEACRTTVESANASLGPDVPR